MKVLYVKTQVGMGGLERIVVDKMNYLTRHEGYEIAYAYFGNESKESVYELDERIKSYPMNVRATGGLMVKIKSVWKTYKVLNRIINEFKPDVIENADTVVATWLLPFMKRHIPKILESHQSCEGLSINDMHIYKGNLFKIKVNNWLRRKVYPLYDRFVVLTDADKQAWGFNNMEVIGNFSYLKPTTQNVIGGGKNCIKTIMSAGRLTYQKNFDLLIESMALVKESHPDWKLKIWGGGEEAAGLQQLVDKLLLREVVELCGETNDMYSVYENSSIFVCSSRFEGFPLVISEAMQFGLPCVSFSLDAVTGRIIDGKTGFLADKNKRTPQELARAICKCIQSLETSDELSKNAYDTIQQYDVNVIMKRWTGLFEQVTKHP